MYVCASASTPVAAAMSQGAPPRSALVFVLTGPATNASTIAVAPAVRPPVRRHLPRLDLRVAIASGLVLNAVIGAGSSRARTAEVEGRALGLVKFLSAWAFLGLIAFSIQSGPPVRVERAEGARRAFRDLVRREARTKRISGRSIAIAIAIRLGVLARGWTALLVVRPGETGLVRTLSER
ncbi:MAG: hypothetical protein IPP07_25140 [Holophagales bacterium]|nr:hypothetical protein [Holophagales bacterium]